MEQTNSISKEEAERLNKERSFLEKLNNPIGSRFVSDETKELFLDPELDVDELVTAKRPDDISVFHIFSSDPEKRKLSWFGTKKADRRDLFKLLKDDEQFREEFAAAQDERALIERDERENSVQNQTFDFFHKKLGISPSIARDLTFAADFTPIYGESVSVEDAANAFKRGDIGEAAFHGGLVAIGLIPYAGDMLVHALKGNRNAIPKMFGGRGKPEELKSDSIFVYDTSNDAVQPMVGAKGHVAPNSKLVESKKIFNDFLQNEPELSKKVDVDENGELAYTGNIIADIKTMPKPLAKKTVEKLDEMWVKTGWTAGANNRFFTEIDDRDAFFDANKFIQLQKEGYEENKQLLSFLPKQKSDVVNVPDIHYPMKSIMLSDVLKHKKLYDAYPELRNLPIKMFTYNEMKKDFSTLGAYLPSTDAQIRLNPRIFQNEGLKKGEIGFFPKGDDVKWTDYNYKNAPPPDSSVLNRIKSVILHEVQHAIQHIEGFPHTNDRVVKEALDKRKKNNQKKLEEFSVKLEDISNELEISKDPKIGNTERINNLKKEFSDITNEALILRFETDKLENLSNDDIYRNAWNEVESRNVQNRMWMDMSKREKMSPYKTISSTKKFNRRDIIERLATNDETGIVDYDKYQEIMDEYTVNLFDYIEEANKEMGTSLPVFPEMKVPTVAFEEDDIRAILYDFFYEKVTPVEAAHMLKDVDFGPVHQKFGRLYKGYMARERAKINKSLPLFSKENVKKFLVGEKSLIEQAEDDIIELNNFLATPEGAKIGLADVTYYDTEEYLRKGLDKIGEVTPQSVDDTDPFPVFAREPENFDIGKSKYNKILRNEETELRINNPKGNSYYDNDYGKFYGDESKKRVQKLYKEGKLEEFINLYKKTGGDNMSDDMIIDEYFDTSDFKVTAYPTNKDGKGVTVKFHPSELINFPGARGEHRTRHLSSDNIKLDRLKERIAKEGYDPDPIQVVVREDGKPFIYEGNHRLQEAFDSDRDFIEVDLKYIRGGEEANGPLDPERIGLIEKGFLND